MRNKGSGKATTKVVTKTELHRAFKQFEVRSRELKYTNPINVGSYATAGTILPLTQSIIQGDTAQMRDGNSINLVEYDFVWQSQLNTSANFDWVRLIIFIDNFNTGSYPTTTNILMSAVTGSPLERFVFITKRYRVLFDQVCTLTSSGSNKITHIKHKIKLKDHHVEYLGATSAEASNGAGALFALVLGDAASNFSAYSLNGTVKYYDA